MLLEEEKMSNKNELRTDLLSDKYAPYKNVNLGILKELLFVLAGNVFTLSLIATIVSLILFNVNIVDRTCITEFVSYSIIFALMITILRGDIKKYLPKFKNWVPYVVGVAVGLSVLLLDELYVRFVNIFYTTGNGGNGTDIGKIVSIYPVASLFMFGFIGPMCEELTYRVGLFGSLKRWNRVWAYIISSLVFGFIHMKFQGNIATEFILLPTYVFPGVMFALAYDMYDLPCSYTAHITNNLIAIISVIIKVHS